MNDGHNARAPYTGLRPFESHEADLFFGREDQIEEMLSKLETHRFLAVVGASGCGKSSLVRAGLLPALADGFLMSAGTDWRFVIMRPGDDPFGNLAHAITSSIATAQLRRKRSNTEPVDPATDEYALAITEKILRGSRGSLADALDQNHLETSQPVLVLIDQFEELFRFRDQARRQPGIDLYQVRNQATAFVELLLHSVQQRQRAIYVVLTMRSDFMGNCDAFPSLPEAISRSQFLTPRMTRDQLALAIEEPLLACGFTIEPGFVNRLLNDAGNDPDQLPLLQHALLRTWARHRESPMDGSETVATRVMRLSDYGHVGGVGGALNQHAEWLYSQLGDKVTNGSMESTKQVAARRLFCALSNQFEGGPITRRPLTLEQACLETGATQTDLQAVATTFHSANLLVFSPPNRPLGPTTRVDISHESLLRQWKRLEKWIEAESASARSYRRLCDAVLSGERLLTETHLNQAEEWLRVARPTVYWAMRYDAAESAAESSLPACCRLIEDSRLAIAHQQEKERTATEREKQLLRSQAEAAETASRRFRARTRLAILALILAIAFLVLALINLREAKIATSVARQNEAKAFSAQIQADMNRRSSDASRKLAEERQSNALRQNAEHFWRFGTIARDAKDPEAIKASHLFLKGANNLAEIAPEYVTAQDVRWLKNNANAASHADRWLIRSWIGDVGWSGYTISPSKTRFLTFGRDNLVRLWHIASAEPVAEFYLESPALFAEFGSDDTRFVTGSGQAAQVWAIDQTKPLATFHRGKNIGGIMPSKDCSKLLTWGAGMTVEYWDIAHSEPLATWTHPARVIAAHFSPDESRVLAVAGDFAREWRIDTANTSDKAEPTVSIEHYKHILNAAYSPDGSKILTWSTDNTVRVWDIVNARNIVTYKHDSSLIGARFSQDTTKVLTWSHDGTARLWDLDDSESRAVYRHSMRVWRAHFSSDESLILTCSGDNTARLWDATTSQQLISLAHDGVYGAALSPDDSMILTWGDDQTTRLWDRATGTQLALYRHNGSIVTAEFLDNSHVLTAGYDEAIHLWNTVNPSSLAVLTHDNAINGAQFTNDGRKVLTWSVDHTLRLWDLSRPNSFRTFQHDGRVFGAQFNSDNSRIMSWSEGQTVRVWDTDSTEPIAVFTHASPIGGAQFNRAGTKVLSYGDSNSAQLWAVDRSEPLAVFNHDAEVTSAQFSRDETKVLTTSLDQTAILWDIDESKRLAVCRHSDGVEGVKLNEAESQVLIWGGQEARLCKLNMPEDIRAFSIPRIFNGAGFCSDDAQVIIASSDGRARLWDRRESEPVRVFLHEDGVSEMQFTRDKSRFLTCGGETVRLWNTRESNPWNVLPLTGFVGGARFSRDETQVLTWSAIGSTQLWDVDASEPLMTFPHDVSVDGSVFSPDNAQALTWYGFTSHTAKLWDLTDPLASLTPSERVLELEVRSAKTVNDKLQLRSLSFEQWQAKVRSAEYQAVLRKLSSTGRK